MTPDQRKTTVLQQEGFALHLVGNHGVDDGAEIIRLQVDGLVNALIRIEGADKAAPFVFALGDRVAGGLREPTDYRAPAPALPPPPDVEPATKPLPRVLRFKWPTYILGFIHGAMAVLFWMVWRAS